MKRKTYNTKWNTVQALLLGLSLFFGSALSFAQPSNDSPCNALSLPIGVLFTSDNIGATADPGEVTPGAGSGPESCNSNDGWCFFETEVQTSVWFTLVVPVSGALDIKSEGFDTQIAVWEVSDCSNYGSFVELAGNDDGLEGSGPLDGSQLLLSCLTPGSTLYVQVDGFADPAFGGEGIFTLIANDRNFLPLIVDAGLCQTRFPNQAQYVPDTNYLKADASGGAGNYSFEWSPTGLYFDEDKSKMAVQPSVTTTYSVTVTDDEGCTATDQVTVQILDAACTTVPPGGEFTTWDQDSWGSPNTTKAPVNTLYAEFNNVFPSGVVLGQGNYTYTFTNAQAITTYLPNYVRPYAIRRAYTNPGPDGNELASELLAAKLNVGFDEYLPNFSPRPGTLSELVYVGTPFPAGITVPDLLLEADKALAGQPAAATINELTDALNLFNRNFYMGASLGAVIIDGIEINRTPVNGGQCTFVACVPPSEVDYYLNLPGQYAYNIGPASNPCQNRLPYFPPFVPAIAVIDVFTDVLGVDVSYTLTNLTTGVVLIDRPQGTLGSLVLYSDTLELNPDHCFEFVINDLIGDGICCLLGNGYWTINFDGTIFNSPTGGAFGFSESQQFGNCGGSGSGFGGQSVEGELSKSITPYGKIYPNPFSDQATLEILTTTDEEIYLSLFNELGQKIKTIDVGGVKAQEKRTLSFTCDEVRYGIIYYKLASKSGRFMDHGTLFKFR